MSLLQNAVWAIQVGIEDFDSNDERRLLSAIRNLHAGILLLCKVKLQELSPKDSDEVLLKQKFDPRQRPDGSVEFIGSGKKTVDQQQIQERLSSLGVKLGWGRLKKISDIRNHVEHYYFSGTRQQIREAVAESCVVIRQLVMDVLGRSPSDLIGEDSWRRLFEVREVFDQELQACRESLASVKWLRAAEDAGNQLKCPACESMLLGQTDPANTDQTEIRFRCTSCGARPEVEDTLEFVLGDMYAGELFASAKEDCESPLEDCPECGRTSYVIEDGACAICDFEMPDDAECAVCGESLSLEDYGAHGSLCSYHAWVADRERDR
jgi:transcription elongation factor Elf1